MSMSRIAAVAGIAVAIAAAAGPASAQIQQLPATSRAEAQTNAINNSLATQQQTRGIVQQNQFETNAIRSDLSRPSVALPTPVAPAIVAPGVAVGR